MESMRLPRFEPIARQKDRVWRRACAHSKCLLTETRPWEYPIPQLSPERVVHHTRKKRFEFPPSAAQLSVVLYSTVKTANVAAQRHFLCWQLSLAPAAGQIRCELQALRAPQTFIRKPSCLPRSIVIGKRVVRARCRFQQRHSVRCSAEQYGKEISTFPGRSAHRPTCL